MASERLLVQSGYGLYPYQRQVLGDILSALRPSRVGTIHEDRRVLVHMPTGAGKTRVACHTACSLLNQPDAEGKLVVWLASTEELCQQASEDLARAWSYLGNREIWIHQYWGNSSPSLDRLGEGFLVAGLQKLWASGSRDPTLLLRLSHSVSGVIFDEAHQAVARTYRFVTEQLLTDNPPLVGLTATPGRSVAIGADDYELAQLFNQTRATIDPRGHGSAVVYLIRNGYLAEPEFISMEVDSNVEVDDPPDGFDYTIDDLTTIGHDAAWTAMIVEVALAAMRRHQRVMVFCPSVQCAEECAEAVAANGFNGQAVSAGTPHERRRDVISEFRRDDDAPMAIFNFGVLTAGFDAPRTACVVVARPTTSLVLYSQMVGRALRGPLSGGNRKAQIYTVVDINLPGFGSVVDAYGHWEGLWLQT